MKPSFLNHPQSPNFPPFPWQQPGGSPDLGLASTTTAPPSATAAPGKSRWRRHRLCPGLRPCRRSAGSWCWGRDGKLGGFELELLAIHGAWLNLMVIIDGWWWLLIVVDGQVMVFGVYWWWLFFSFVLSDDTWWFLVLIDDSWWFLVFMMIVDG